MGQSIPRQHPAVVLRSHYRHLRALLAIAIACVVCLAVAVVILAGNDGVSSGAPSAADPARTEFQVPSHAGMHGGAAVPDLHVGPLPNGQRYDGGPEEGTRGVIATRPTTTSGR